MLLAVLMTFLLALSVRTHKANAADLSGSLVNGTEGGQLPEEADILMFAIQNGTGELLESQKMSPEPNGMFLFSGVAEGEDVAYRLIADLPGYTPILDVPPGMPLSDLQLTIWDHTADPSILYIRDYSVLTASADQRNRSLTFLATTVVANPTDKVWVPKAPEQGLTGPDLFRFNLPQGYQDLSIETNLPQGNVLEISTGFALTTPVPPGEYSIVIAYSLPYEGSVVEAPYRLAHGSDNFRFLHLEGAGEVKGTGLEYTGMVEVPTGDQVIVFNTWEGTGYTPGDSIGITISGLPQPTLLERLAEFTNGQMYATAIALVIAALLLALFVYAVRVTLRARQAYVLGAEGEVPNLAGASRSDIVKRIAELDAMHEAGNIPEKRYRRNRDHLKAQALAKTEPEEQKLG